MDDKKFKVGYRVRRIGNHNASRGAKVGQIATVIGFHGASGIVVTYDGHTGDSMDKAGEAWLLSNTEPAPITEWEAALDAGEMYFTTKSGLFVMKRAGSGFRCYEVPDRGENAPWVRKDIESCMRDGYWDFAESPAPAVDPVVAATAEVQRLLREQDAANSERREAWVVLEAAEKKLRNIGKVLNEAKRALGVAMHDAAGVKYEEDLPF